MKLASEINLKMHFWTCLISVLQPIYIPFFHQHNICLKNDFSFQMTKPLKNKNLLLLVYFTHF